MAILLASHYPDYIDIRHWVETLNAALPEVDIEVWPELRDPQAVELIVGDFMPDGIGDRYPKLRAVMYVGAGVDAMLRDPAFPKHIPLIRSNDAAITFQVAQYIAWQILDHHRHGAQYRRQQADKIWRPIPTADTRSLTVGILGYGRIGKKAARILRELEFKVIAWSRSARPAEDGVEHFVGAAGLTDILAASDYVVSALPLTPATTGILDRRAIAAMKPGAFLINVGRGRQIVDDDLLEALDVGRLSGAALDVFREEPLPKDHRYWTHPSVVVTPHVANFSVDGSLPQIIDLWHRLQDGRPLENLIDREAGY